MNREGAPAGQGEGGEGERARIASRAVLGADDIAACVRVLETAAEDRGVLAELPIELRRRLLVAAGRVSKPSRAEQRDLAKTFRRKERTERRASDAAALDATGIRALRREPVFRTPAGERALPPGAAPPPPPPSAPPPSGAPPLREPRKCYVCKAEFRALHFFYDAMCPSCGDFNFAKRTQTASLAGQVALVTGARVKIGYQTAIKLLRAGARVIVTTRFPHDAAVRYAAEADYDDWRDRLSIYGLDLRHTPSVELLARHLDRTLDRLDHIVNNACQTVRRPPGFYAHLVAGESAPLDALPEAARPLCADYDALRARGEAPRLPGASMKGHDAGLRAPALLTQLPGVSQDLAPAFELFPEGRLDADLQQIDLRTMNSWRLGLADVPTIELLEVQLVNAVAPYVLNARLKPLMMRQRTDAKHVVNVSAMEGQFYRQWKTDRHPHTNMAKAALNMMTRTSSADYAKDGIFMNSVDTGWVTDEDPAVLAERKVLEHGFHPPLDIVDGAARVVDPIFTGVATGKHVHGLFLKDYAPTDW
jgi:NAD(P)-dependent dehydrogenase (short-subunit alcohol dehydrogenase family)